MYGRLGTGFHSGKSGSRITDSHLAYLETLVEMIPERAVLADSASELQKGVEEGKWVFIRTIEGGAALGGDLEKIVHFAKKKIKMMTLTWNGENELGSGCAGTGGLRDLEKRP